MENLDTKTLVHVGVELVIIGGLTFWFQRKTSLQQEEINNLREELNKTKEIINRQGALLAQHERILSQFTGGNFPPQHEGRRRPEPVFKNRSSRPNQYTSYNPPGGASQVHEEVDEVDNEELDNILKEELGNMHRSKEKSDEEIIELECNGDVCELKKTKNLIKSDIKKKRKKGKK